MAAAAVWHGQRLCYSDHPAAEQRDGLRHQVVDNSISRIAESICIAILLWLGDKSSMVDRFVFNFGWR